MTLITASYVGNDHYISQLFLDRHHQTGQTHPGSLLTRHANTPLPTPLNRWILTKV